MKPEIFKDIENAQELINRIIEGAPQALDTLIELSNALNNDPDFAANITNLINQKLGLSGGSLTGLLELPMMVVKNNLPAIDFIDNDETTDMFFRIVYDEINGSIKIQEFQKSTKTWKRDILTFNKAGEIFDDAGRKYIKEDTLNKLDHRHFKNSGGISNVAAFINKSHITKSAGYFSNAGPCMPYTDPGNGPHNWYLDSNTPIPSNIIIDLGNIYVGIYGFSFGSGWYLDKMNIPRSFTIDVSTDGQIWTRAVTWDFVTKGVYNTNTIILPDTPGSIFSAKFIRFTVTDVSANFANNPATSSKAIISAFSCYTNDSGKSEFSRIWHDSNVGNRPHVYWGFLADQTLSSGVTTKLNLNWAGRDHMGNLDTANKRFIVKEEGVYAITGSITSGSIPSGAKLAAMLYTNGTRTINLGAYMSSGSLDGGVQLSGNIFLYAGDYIEIYAIVQNGSITISKDFSFVSVTRIA